MSIYEFDEEKYTRLVREEGREIGQEQVNNLNLKLSELGRMDDIVKAAADPEYQKKLFEEFHL